MAIPNGILMNASLPIFALTSRSHKVFFSQSFLFHQSPRDRFTASLTLLAPTFITIACSWPVSVQHRSLTQSPRNLVSE